MSKEPHSASVSQTRTPYLTALFHFLSQHSWLRSFAFLLFHLHSSHADALGSPTHANSEKKHQTKLSRAHLSVKTYSFPTEVRLPDNVSHAVMYQYVLTFSPTHWLTLLLPFFSLPFILKRYQYNIYTRQADISQFVQFRVFLLSFHCACEMH